ncbi:hypothetical protein N865_10180 [Intrasporangium oryzae NRRL B-24470]|uniref:CopC domain-containing protein n=1 Tax=Intrasporangium oryzae NRRL B-24470 TaxID=1386089 RepID=W9GCG8_9MICO|nr:hypothetical protein [Intrasporangium oryzae]EWT01529.1 hypothetical protein N865_10180 [Intrasporangium oryzae NRRL B-24470]
MRGALRTLGAIAVALATAIALTTPADAHGGEEGMVVEPAATSAGAVVSVRGDLPTTSSIVLVLESSAGRTVTLARVEDPPQGHFDTQVAVPATVTPGAWHLQARVGDTVLAERELLVSEAAQPPAGDDRAEPVVVPTGPASAALSAIRPDAGSLSAGHADPSGRSEPTPWWPYAVLVLALVGAVAWMRRRDA